MLGFAKETTANPQMQQEKNMKTTQKQLYYVLKPFCNEN